MPEPLSDERLRELREQAEVGHVVITSRGVLALIEEVEGLRAERAEMVSEGGSGG